MNVGFFVESMWYVQSFWILKTLQILKNYFEHKGGTKNCHREVPNFLYFLVDLYWETDTPVYLWDTLWWTHQFYFFIRCKRGDGHTSLIVIKSCEGHTNKHTNKVTYRCGVPPKKYKARMIKVCHYVGLNFNCFQYIIERYIKHGGNLRTHTDISLWCG